MQKSVSAVLPFTGFRSARLLAIALAMLGLASCASKDIDYAEADVATIYNDGLEKLADRDYTRAGQTFDEVERQHPYSVWARRAILMSAYSYYMANKYSESVLATERFIGLHPGNKDAPYAYYLKAMCYYEQITDIGRDQKMTEDAMAALDEVVRRFPNTVYARDARLKLDMTRDHLAGKEVEIGRWYLFRHQYAAAINRFRNVILKYQTTSHTAEALHRLTESYLAMGVQNEAQTAAAVLGYNYPGSEWYEDSYRILTAENLQPIEDKKSWISRAWHTVF